MIRNKPIEEWLTDRGFTLQIDPLKTKTLVFLSKSVKLVGSNFNIYLATYGLNDLNKFDVLRNACTPDYLGLNYTDEQKQANNIACQLLKDTLDAYEKRMEEAHKSIFLTNAQNEEIELLNYDKKTGLSMIQILNRTYTPYVVVSGLNLQKGEWNAGCYFEKEDEAYDFYQESVNALDENRYRHTVEYLIREEFEAVGETLSNEEVSELYNNVLMKSSEPKILNTNILEAMEEYLTKDDVAIDSNSFQKDNDSHEER